MPKNLKGLKYCISLAFYRLSILSWGEEVWTQWISLSVNGKLVMFDSNSRMLLSSGEFVRLNSIPMSSVLIECAGTDFNFVSSFKYFQNLSFVFNSPFRFFGCCNSFFTCWLQLWMLLFNIPLLFNSFITTQHQDKQFINSYCIRYVPLKECSLSFVQYRKLWEKFYIKQTNSI